MKLSTDRLKNLDYKQLAVDHGEKVVAVLIAVFIVWALFQTNWMPYQKDPAQLAQLAEETREEIMSTAWPEAEVKKFQPKVQLAEDVDRLLSEVNAAKYNFTTPYVWPLYRQKEPISEPTYVPVENLLADAGQVLLPMKAEQGSEPVVAATEEKKSEDESSRSEFAPRRERRATAGAPRTRAGQLSAFGGNDKKEDVASTQRYQELLRQQQRFNRRRSRKRDDEGAAGYRSSEKGRGYRFVAVRGVFPLHQQLQELRKAMHIDTITTQDLLERVQFHDFELQRQTAIRGAADPWSGPWEPVDVAIAKMVLNESDGIEDDTLALGVTSNIFTAPLPYRAVGDWGPLASNTRLKDFELTDDQIEAQIKISQALLEKMRNEQAKEAKTLQPGGFSDLQEDVRAPLMATRTGREAELADLIKELGKDASNDDERKKLEELIKNREKNPEGNLLLFRYVDFDVRSGYTYRYRVRLVLYNPFYGLPPEDVVSPEVAEGQLRYTEWSKETQPATVPDDADYFVTGVELDRPGVIPNARVDLYQWSPDSGTIVHDKLKALVGQYIAGKKKTYVLRPVPETFEQEEFTFATDDVLVDLMQRPTLEKSLYPDLTIPGDAKEIPGLSDQALVMNQFGELVTIDPSVREDLRDRIASRFEEQNKFWQDIKDAILNSSKGPTTGKRGDDDEGGFGRLSPSSNRDNPRRKANSRRN